MAQRRAYLIYECDHGWCYEPHRTSSVREYPENTRAFSKLSQLVWFLQKEIQKNVDANTAQAAKAPPTKERDETRPAVKAVA